MTRILNSLLASAALAVAAQAQCFEANFGTLLGTGDDTLFASQPLNINFPMGGAVPVATHVRVNTNGCAFLWSAATGELNTTNSGYATSAATMVTNLRGTAGGAPRIAPFWRDLNMTAGNGAGVYLNNTIPGKAVITWQNAAAWASGAGGTTGPVFTFQAQLFDTGVVEFYYGPTANNINTVPLAGISEGGAIADAGASDLAVSNVGVSTSKIVYETWATASTFDLAGKTVTFTPNGGGGYDTSVGACLPASNNNYGVGCYAIPGTGIYEAHADSTLASAALQGNAIQLAISGNGYQGTWVTGGASAYLAPSGGATSLTVADDGVATVTGLPSIPTPTGPVTELGIASNGIVTLGAAGNNGSDFSPTGPEFAAATGRGFYAWHDFNSEESGSGLIKVELVGSVLCVTWDGVESYASPEVLNPTTMQFQFDTVTGSVAMVFVTVDSNATSTFGSNYIVGWKAAGAVADAGSQVLATALPLTNVGATSPLTLGLSNLAISTPSSGSTITYNVTNIPLACPSPSPEFHFGGLMISLGQDLAGTDLLSGYGVDAPGCSLHVTSIDILLPYIETTSSISAVPFDVPSAVPAGFEFYAQAFSLICPNSLPNGLNAAGVTVSNGVRSVVSSF